ncbi:membrane-bound ATP synthase subunit, F1-F0-type proton-ATPase [marine sediment metagenome]|uniref:Membrane-bound ATP synthase subunit, F1-F0-type proton-ATPase n=1 Tax=marine sediment metagenome TaxID=412755 RepID=A0A1B6NP50_9ZZZZ
MKLALTIILFVIAFKGLNAAPLEIFLAFVITTASHGLAMFHYGTKAIKTTQGVAITKTMCSTDEI